MKRRATSNDDDIEMDGLDSPKARAEDEAVECEAVLKRLLQLAKRRWTKPQRQLAAILVVDFARRGDDLVL